MDSRTNGATPAADTGPAGPAPAVARPVAIIILTWNALAFTKRCFEALRTVTDHPAWRLIVVDNGSTDGTLDYLRSLDWITLIENGKNLGFTKGNNIGIRATKQGEDVVLMNNDVFVDDPLWLHKIQELALADERNGIVGTRLIDAEGRINHLGSFMPPITLYGQQMGGLELDINQCVADREIECTVFALCYIRRDVINRIGVLDEDLFAYFEDTEYCFRARRAGYRVMYAGSVSPTHAHNTSTKENKVDFWSMYLKSRTVFERKWAKWLEHERYDTSLVWHSVVHKPLGYATHSKEMMLALHDEGVKVSYQNAYGEKDGPVEQHLIADFMQRKPQADAHVAYSMAQYFGNVKGKLRVGFSMLEVTGLPHDWVDGCNHMHEVWVPAQFNVESFKASGVRVPIRTMPLGVDTDYFHPGIKGFRPTDRFTFLSVFEWGERKAPEVLLRAFAEEFKPSEDVALLLNVFNHDPQIDVAAEITKLDLPDSAPIVLMLNPEFIGYQRGSLLRSADCFVSPTRGEGWGANILEAMACGLPTIATGWSGPADFMDESVGYPIDYKLVPAVARCPYYEGFEWAEPDAEHLRTLMRRVYEQPQEARAKGLAAAERVAANYTWKHTAQRIKQRLLELQ